MRKISINFQSFQALKCTYNIFALLIIWNYSKKKRLTARNTTAKGSDNNNPQTKKSYAKNLYIEESLRWNVLTAKRFEAEVSYGEISHAEVFHSKSTISRIVSYQCDPRSTWNKHAFRSISCNFILKLWHTCDFFVCLNIPENLLVKEYIKSHSRVLWKKTQETVHICVYI